MTYSLRQDSEEAKINKDLYGSIDGYHWNLDNWGCKWDVGDGSGSTYATLGVTGTVLTAGFQSPWSPPVEGVRRISQQFPDATFTLTFWEEGCDFCGAAVMKSGSIEVSDQHTVEAVQTRWQEENHPELYAKAEAEEWDGDASDELNELWWDVAYDELMAYTTQVAEGLGGQMTAPEVHAENHRLEREKMEQLLKASLDLLNAKQPA